MRMDLALLHPPVTHFPIALLLLGSAAGLLYLGGVRCAALPVLTWWPLRLGWLGAALAVLTGLLAQSGLPPRAAYSDVLNWHIGSGIALLVVYGTLLYRHWLWKTRRAKAMRRLAPEEAPAEAAHDLLDMPAARRAVAVLLVLGMTLVAASGWLGGELVYTWGVNVTR
jgi:uncharacterized membrane protein